MRRIKSNPTQVRWLALFLAPVLIYIACVVGVVIALDELWQRYYTFLVLTR